MQPKSLLLTLNLASSSMAFFRMSCPGRITRERLDSIVSPGKVSGHVHNIAGGSGFSKSMTYQDARAAKCSSCTIKEDKSNYWTPQLYVQFPNGTFSPVPVAGDPQDVTGGMTVYYLQRPGSANETLKAFPPGFRMLAGDSFKRSGDDTLATKGISYNCIGANKPETNNIPPYQCPNGLRAQVFFPSCWNGKDLDTADHKSHMSYPVGQNYDNGPCPADFPVHFISLFYEVLYDTAPFNYLWNGTQHPFVFANGDPTGYGLHGDFFNGWDVDVLQRAVDTCTDDSGLVERCAAVTQYSTEDTRACKLPPVVNEPVSGALSKLPGCNPVTPGPNRASAVSCPSDAQVTFDAPPTYFKDMTSSKKWAYVGCGTDNAGDRAFPMGTGADNMTIETCLDYCASKNQTYAGLEYSRECFCGSALNPKYAPRDGFLGDCGMRCAGDNSEVCGGWATMSIYRKCADGESCGNFVFGKSAASKRGVDAEAVQVRKNRYGGRAL